MDRTYQRPVVWVVKPSVQSSSTLSDWVEAAVKIRGVLLATATVAKVVEKVFEPSKAKQNRRIAPLPVIEEDELDDIEWIFYRTAGYCFYCNKRLCLNNRGYFGGIGAWEPDHFIPFSRNGADQPYNLVATCVACNRLKRDLYPWEFDSNRFFSWDRKPDNYIQRFRL